MVCIRSLPKKWGKRHSRSAYSFSMWVFTLPFTAESSRLIWTTDTRSCSHFTSSSLPALPSWHHGVEIFKVTESLESISHLLPLLFMPLSSALVRIWMLYQHTQNILMHLSTIHYCLDTHLLSLFYLQKMSRTKQRCSCLFFYIITLSFLTIASLLPVKLDLYKGSTSL